MGKLKISFVISLFLLSIFSINSALASQGNCDLSDFEYCQETTKYPPSLSRIFFNLKDEGNSNGINYGYPVGRFYAEVGFTGDYAYKGTNINSWNDITCNDVGNGNCRSSTGTLSLIGLDLVQEVTLANKGETYTKCPTFIAWDKTSGYWSWAGYGWLGSGNCFNMKVVECYADSDCSGNDVCNKEGGWQTWKCEEPLQEGECRVDSDCPSVTTESFYCSDGNVVKNKTMTDCVNNQCIQAVVEDDKLVESCEFGCSQNPGQYPVCTTGCLADTDCENGKICQNSSCILKPEPNYLLYIVLGLTLIIALIMLIVYSQRKNKKGGIN